MGRELSLVGILIHFYLLSVTVSFLVSNNINRQADPYSKRREI